MPISGFLCRVPRVADGVTLVPLLLAVEFVGTWRCNCLAAECYSSAHSADYTDDALLSPSSDGCVYSEKPVKD
jgi:hypothetical protein